MRRSGTKALDILQNRSALKTWVVKRIADTPAITEEDREAATWFHDLPVASRSTLVTDLARLGVPGVDLEPIARGPVGDLYRRLPQLSVVEVAKVEFENSSEHIHRSMSELQTAEPAWADSWKEFEESLEGAVWDVA